MADEKRGILERYADKEHSEWGNMVNLTSNGEKREKVQKKIRKGNGSSSYSL
jgi:hypothetical protein